MIDFERIESLEPGDSVSLSDYDVLGGELSKLRALCSLFSYCEDLDFEEVQNGIHSMLSDIFQNLNEAINLIEEKAQVRGKTRVKDICSPKDVKKLGLEGVEDLSVEADDTLQIYVLEAIRRVRRFKARIPSDDQAHHMCFTRNFNEALRPLFEMADNYIGFPFPDILERRKDEEGEKFVEPERKRRKEDFERSQV